ncbi:MAG TPA: acetyl-CoA carboxylase biotin carboxylase subunit [Dehalococcoidia bacterium]|nr:acetyl-CoA carboxylase biotin carboxylase subunit [Dehalococcoidia bacterium]
MFKKLLVANRGEIALRVMRTCREMGIATVAVYSEADRSGLHVRYADEAYLLGPGTPGESYLNVRRVMDVAKRCGAEAIHPGYGFLAENPSFVGACERARIVFVGPTSRTMRVLGDKIAARKLATEAGVPVVPGAEDASSCEEALAAADRLGYPVLVKAVSGGGGKGIRIVASHSEMEAALRIAGSEAASAFGDHKLYVEKFLDNVRHVEVQFLADAHGGIVALGERECSVQRRHQKLVEESPSPAVDASLRERLCAAAIAVARAARYRNAGTAEFLLQGDGRFYFLEINARLQVEHPVTELVTGIDLVAEQLRIASGEGLSLGQEDVELRGWAMECRIAAEDPFRDFLPSLGRVDYVSQPAGPGIRVDSALFAGIDIPYYYDPMIAKVLAWGHDRAEAIRRMQRALAEFVVVGVDTNIPLHLQLLRDPRFLAGEVHTTFLEREFTVAPAGDDEGRQAALLAAAVLAHRREKQVRAAISTRDGGAWKAHRRLGAMRGGEAARSRSPSSGEASWRRHTD